MATQRFKKYWHAAMMVMLSLGGVSACSSSNPEEEGLEPSAAMEGADGAAADGADTQASAPVPTPTAAPAPAEPAPKAVTEPAETAQAPAAPVGDQGPAAAQPEATAAGVTPPPDKSRVVRHVKVKKAALRASPSTKADVVGQLSRGERILVDVEKGWGRIADGMYIKLSDTAARPIAVKRRPAEWQAPAHQ